MSLVTETPDTAEPGALYRKLRKQRGSRDRGNQGQIQEKSGDLHRTLFPADSDISDPDGGDRVV